MFELLCAFVRFTGGVGAAKQFTFNADSTLWVLACDVACAITLDPMGAFPVANTVGNIVGFFPVAGIYQISHQFLQNQIISIWPKSAAADMNVALFYEILTIPGAQH